MCRFPLMVVVWPLELQAMMAVDLTPATLGSMNTVMELGCKSVLTFPVRRVRT